MYERLFQQPVVEIDQAVAPYSWFEFLFDEQLLFTHIQRVEKDPSSTPTAFDLMNEFLEHADNDDLDAKKHARRDKLVELATQIVLSLQIPLQEIEKQLTFRRQWTLMESIIAQAQRREDQKQRLETEMNPNGAIVMRNRWVIRAFVNHNTMILHFDSKKSEAADIFSILSNLHNGDTALKTLEDLIANKSLDESSRAEAYEDMGEYLFSTSNFSESLKYFKLAKAAFEGTSTDRLLAISGFVTACDTILRTSSPSKNDPKGVHAVQKMVELEQWQEIVEVLKNDNCITNDNALNWSYRVELANKAWSRWLDCSEQEKEQRKGRLSAYQQICICNAIRRVVRVDDPLAEHESVADILRVVGLNDQPALSSEGSEASVKFTFDCLQQSKERMMSELPEKVLLLQHLESKLKRLLCDVEVNLKDKVPGQGTLNARMRKARSIATEQTQFWEKRRSAGMSRSRATPEVIAEIQDKFSKSTLSIPESEAFVSNLLDSGNWQALSSISQKVRSQAQENNPIVMETIQVGASIGQLMKCVQSITSDIGNFEGKALKSVVETVLDLILAVRKLRIALGQQGDRRWFLIENCSLNVAASVASVCAGLLVRTYVKHPNSALGPSIDLNPYGDIAIIVGLHKISTTNSDTIDDCIEILRTAGLSATISDIYDLLFRCVRNLVSCDPREWRWHAAHGDLLLHPVRSSSSHKINRDTKAAICEFVIAAYLSTDFFRDGGANVFDVIGMGLYYRLMESLLNVGSFVEAAVLCQALPGKKYQKGLEILRQSPEAHNKSFYQFIWESSYLEILHNIHESADRTRDSQEIKRLLRSPELNIPRASSRRKDLQRRILCSFFRELCRVYVSIPL